MTALPPPLDPPTRLLCGPGPSNVSPDVLAAMQRPMLGHLDPDIHQIMTEVVHLLRGVYRADAGLVLPLQATGSSGMEAGLETVLVLTGLTTREAAEREPYRASRVVASIADLLPDLG